MRQKLPVVKVTAKLQEAADDQALQEILVLFKVFRHVIPPTDLVSTKASGRYSTIFKARLLVTWRTKPRKDSEEQYRKRKLHYVFDTDFGGIMTRARFSGKKGSFEPS